jgi:hypothetical protein
MVWRVLIIVALVLAAAGAGGTYWYLKYERGVLHGVIFDTLGYPRFIFFPNDGAPPLALLVTDSLVNQYPLDKRAVVRFDTSDQVPIVCVSIEARIVPRGSPEVADRVGAWEQEYVTASVVIANAIRSSVIFDDNREKWACRLPRLQRVRGVYARGRIEHSVLTPQGSTEPLGWWIEYAPFSDQISLGPPIKDHPFMMALQYACVDLTGVVTPRGLYGHGGIGGRQFFPTKLNWSAPHDSADPSTCKVPN